MSTTMTWAEHLVMAIVISVSVAVMIALVFLGEHQSKSAGTAPANAPASGRVPCSDRRRGPPHGHHRGGTAPAQPSDCLVPASERTGLPGTRPMTQELRQ